MKITGNVIFSLRTQLKGKPCQPHGMDLRVATNTSYTYPEVVVVCGEPIFADKYYSIMSPTVILEVLSDTTEKIELTSLGFSLTAQDVYEGVRFG